MKFGGTSVRRRGGVRARLSKSSAEQIEKNPGRRNFGNDESD